MAIEFEAAFAGLFARASRLAQRILGDRAAAEDVAAEALTRAWAGWDRVGSMAHRDAWVLRVATNLALEQVRRRPPPATAGPAADTADLVVLRLALVDALRALPDRQRQAIALRYFADLAGADVARALGVSVGTAKTHIHRGLAALRGQFGADVGRRLRAFQEGTMRVRTSEEARQALEEGRVLTGRVVRRAFGPRPGWDWLEVDIGLPARLLSSAAGWSIGDDYEWLIGQDVEVKVVHLDEDEHVFVSRRAVLETERVRALRRAMLEALPVGRPLVGKVTLVLPFGAFVDLDGVFGLLPATEFAAEGESPQDLKLRNEPECDQPVARGRGVRVEVASVDVERGRAMLRLSTAADHPIRG